MEAKKALIGDSNSEKADVDAIKTKFTTINALAGHST